MPAPTQVPTTAPTEIPSRTSTVDIPRDELSGDYVLNSAAAPDRADWFGTLAGASLYMPEE